MDGMWGISALSVLTRNGNSQKVWKVGQCIRPPASRQTVTPNYGHDARDSAFCGPGTYVH